MSMKVLSMFLIVGIATAEQGQKAYSPKHNLKTYGNPFGPVAYNNIGMGDLSVTGSSFGSGYPLYGHGYGNMYGIHLHNLAVPNNFGVHVGMGYYGRYPGYSSNDGRGYNGLYNVGGYGMSSFGGLNGYGLSGFGGYDLNGYGMQGIGGHGMQVFGGYGMQGYGGYGMGGYGGYGMKGLGARGYHTSGKMFGKKVGTY